MRALPGLLLPLVLVAACAAPPQKEIDLAQGAIDAARAAGAEEYATQSFTQATTALQQAHDAVAQRDYRLALTRALDAHARAQDAARGAADGKARARGDADAAIVAAAAAITELQQRIRSAEVAKFPRRAIQAAHDAARDAETSLQKARAAVSSGHYGQAHAVADALPKQILADIDALDAAGAKKPPAPARRRR